MIGSVVLCALIYILLEVAFIGAAPAKGLAHGWSSLSFANHAGPLAGIATLLGLGWLAILLYIDAVVSPADTGLIYTTVTARISYAMGRNRNAPSALSRVSNRGVPWVSVIVTFVAGLIVFLPFPGWQQLVTFITEATVLSFGTGSLVLAAMRRQIPDQPRSFRLPGGDVIPFLAFYASNLVVYFGGWNTDWKLFAAVGIGFVLFAIHHALTRAHAPALEWRSAAWIAPWLLGLLLISKVGAYKGGLNWLPYPWGFLVLLVFSALIYALAVHLRLPDERAKANIEEAGADDVPPALAE